ncbi:dolichol-phosphate mannosyltransferase [Sesbania bispinosa]|nr:dolichol-phosphate mannosyltransferase [Sesbania bispinosa]KAJ1378537.1 dolichol-phosphate mannosyltransferase [Sesbania bispinosa]KAJ1378541.1 dolichol-phosphate mannosyltransferase [Sesbania bispinosa]
MEETMRDGSRSRNATTAPVRRALMVVDSRWCPEGEGRRAQPARVRTVGDGGSTECTTIIYYF